MTNKITYLEDGEVCIISNNKVDFYNSKNIKINKKILTLSMINILRRKVIIKILCQKRLMNKILQLKIVLKNMLTNYGKI